MLENDTFSDGMDEIGDNFGRASIFVFLAMFGGSTFILFLLCYFCQKKLQYGEDVPVTAGNETPPRQVFIIPPAAISNRQPVPTSPPPPDYYTVMEKDGIYQDSNDPPPYDVAVAKNSTSKGLLMAS